VSAVAIGAHLFQVNGAIKHPHATEANVRISINNGNNEEASASVAAILVFIGDFLVATCNSIYTTTAHYNSFRK